MTRKRKIGETIRTIFQSLPDVLRLREPPTAKIDEKVLRQVFGPEESLMNAASDNPGFRPLSHEPKK